MIVVKPIEIKTKMFVSRLEGRERERERGIIGGGSAANRLISKPTPDAGTALCLNKSLWYLCSCVVLCCVVVRLSIHRINYQYDLVVVFYW